MAQLDTGGGGGGKHQKQRAKKASTHIDMTPMVDLAFLLLTFFILTSTFSKPKTMEITMPDDKDTAKKTEVKNVITFILSEKDKIYYYEKVLQDDPVLKETNFSKDGVRKILSKINDPVIKKVAALGKKMLADKSLTTSRRDSLFAVESNKLRGEKSAVTVIIKADDKAKYRNVVDMIDEMGINDIDKYAIVTQFIPLETKLLSEKQ